MSEIDIRDSAESSIDTIRICDRNNSCYLVELLVKESPSYPEFLDSSGGEPLTIESKQHALNIKKAIDKAIELGWWD